MLVAESGGCGINPSEVCGDVFNYTLPVGDISLVDGEVRQVLDIFADCSPLVRVFTCGVYTRPCTSDDLVLGFCHDLCQAVYSDCLSRLQSLGIPGFINCSQAARQQPCLSYLNITGGYFAFTSKY